MGIITSYGKWNLDKNEWCYLPEHREIGRSFAFADYEKIINNENSSIDYVILAYGTRVEDDSKDFINIKESKRGIDKVISYFKQLNKNIVIKLFLMDADAPIIENAKMLAMYIDNLSLLTSTNSVNLLGLSKGGAMSFNVPKYFKKKSSFVKTNIYTIATPFTGTKLASPGIFYPEVKKIVTSKLGDTQLSNLVYRNLISIYEGISSNSHMDYDIAMLGGIPEEKSQFYDETLIRDMFSSDNLNAISRLNAYKNLVTGIDDKTLNESIRTLNLTGIGLCILDDLLI